MGTVLVAKQTGGAHTTARRLQVWLSRSTFLLVFLLAAWMTWRRSLGALSRPLPVICFAAMAVGLVAATVVVGLPRRVSAGSWQVGIAILWIPVLALCAASVSLPGSDPRGVMVLWFAVGGSAIWITRRDVWRGQLARQSEPPVRARQATVYDFDAESLPSEVDQQNYRGTNDAGETFVGGRTRLLIPPRQKVVHAHFAFCPPLEELPGITVEAVEGPSVTAKVGLLLHQGIRIDVRVSEATPEPRWLVLVFYGTCAQQKV